MAITNNDIRFLFYCKKLGVSFKDTLTLGRLTLYGTHKFIQDQINYFQNNVKKLEDVSFTNPYSDPLFYILGAEVVDSMDYSDYQQANIIQDLNYPVPSVYFNRYTVVIDAGTLEHIFNFPVSISNCMKMIKKGGHYIGITPINNLMGHGFYQFSPELFYRIFSPQNGYEVIKMIITSTDELGLISEWYEVFDPEKMHERVVLCNDYPVYLLTVARKADDVEIFSQMPVQSDYSSVWLKSTLSESKNQSSLERFYRKLIPKRYRDTIYQVRRLLTSPKVHTMHLGNLSKRHFKKIEEL